MMIAFPLEDYSLFSHFFPGFPSQPAVLDWSFHVYKKSLNLPPPHRKTFLVYLYRERNEWCFYRRVIKTWIENSRSSKLHRAPVQNTFFSEFWTILGIHYCQIVVQGMRRWLPEQHRSFAAGSYLPILSQWHLNAVKFIWISLSDGNFTYRLSCIMSGVLFMPINLWL